MFLHFDQKTPTIDDYCCACPMYNIVWSVYAVVGKLVHLITFRKKIVVVDVVHMLKIVNFILLPGVMGA